MWGMVTHFVPKVESAKPPAASASAPAPSVSISGGTINNGFSPEQVQALLKTQGKQRDEQVSR